MSKKRLLVLLGAGSSKAQGMSTVEMLNCEMLRWSREWVFAPEINYYDQLWDNAVRYCEAGLAGPRRAPNFERVLGDMAGLVNWMMPGPYGNPLRESVSSGGMPTGVRLRPSVQSGPYGATIDLTEQLTYLLIRLARHMRDRSRFLNRAAAEYTAYRSILRTLATEFDVGLYNLNYDTAALSAWPEAWTGFDAAGRFDPRAVHRRPQWGFLYHLHGSVHHTLVHPMGDEIRWQGNLESDFDDGNPGNSSANLSDNKSLPKTTLIAGGFKLDRLLIEPFQSYYAALVKHVYEADAILIGGYGFGDAHVNRALRNRLERSENRPPIMLLSWSADETRPMQFRGDWWSTDMNQALYATGHPFSEPGFVHPPQIADLKARAAFEVSIPHKIAIWHGGYIEVANRLDNVMSWLERSEADALDLAKAAP